MTNGTRLATAACMSTVLLWQGAISLQDTRSHQGRVDAPPRKSATVEERAIIPFANEVPARSIWNAATVDPFAKPPIRPNTLRTDEPAPTPVTVAVEISTPEFPYKRFGRMISTDGQAIDYIVHDDAIRLLRAGEVIDGAYRVEQVEDDGLRLTYLPTNTPLQVRTGQPAVE